MLWKRLCRTQAPAAVILIRLMVGLVFLSEGIQKFLYSESVGAGRFAKIGFPMPGLLAVFVGLVEIVCGTLIVIGLLTRLATIPTIIIMLVALATTKLPILRESGFWKMAHESRTDFSMLLGSVFMLLVGAGTCSCDAFLARTRETRQGTPRP
jgi:uncharacterized membrane protein YphA (DoxX/SURF4 family)